MATFDDVTRLFIEGLSQLTKYVPTVISHTPPTRIWLTISIRMT